MTGASVALAVRIGRSRARQRSDARRLWPFGCFLLESLGLCGRVLSIVGAPSRVMRELASQESGSRAARRRGWSGPRSASTVWERRGV